MSDNAPSASQGMARLIEQRERARDHVDGLEAEWRASTERAAAASEALAQFERQPAGSAPQRKKLEAELAAAREAANEPWSERVAGGRQRVADAHGVVQVYAAAHLDELVGELEHEGTAAAARLNAAADDVVAAYHERERIAGELAQTLALGGVRARPGAVTFSKAEALAREATVLLQGGGEVGPTVRDRHTLRGAPPAEPEPEPATAA